jgi:hypothetical protein
MEYGLKYTPFLSFWEEKVTRKEELGKGVAGFTYLSSTKTYLRSRRFPIEIIRPGKYMKIKSKHFQESGNKG